MRVKTTWEVYSQNNVIWIFQHIWQVVKFLRSQGVQSDELRKIFQHDRDFKKNPELEVAYRYESIRNTYYNVVVYQSAVEDHRRRSKAS